MHPVPQHIDDLQVLRERHAPADLNASEARVMRTGREDMPALEYRRPLSCEMHGPALSPRRTEVPCPASDPEQGYSCDREAGHGGSHRAAIETVAWGDSNAQPGASLALTIELSAREHPYVTTDDAMLIAALVDEVDMHTDRFIVRFLENERKLERMERLVAHLCSVSIIATEGV